MTYAPLLDLGKYEGMLRLKLDEKELRKNSRRYANKNYQCYLFAGFA